ncbi:hypothetical protein UFOVP526_23 [uncultured Caudovirales phage]|uniref:Uncharacterized protein n=1 Tax=uncultured Caudovirales phage TaxID=2100421 RepID=A0A6J5MYB9_9CAUD|nr:hypothetical protein UFOVP526_23 [uncultured Caudovirales phage]
MRAYKVTVTDTVTQLVARDNLNRPVYMQIEGNNTVYIGGADVTAAQGFPIVKHSAPIQGGLGVGDGLWGICASGVSEVVRIITVDAD